MVVRCAVIDRLSEAGFQSVLVARFVFGGGILVTAYWQWHCSHSAARWTSVYMLLKSIGEVSHPLLSCWISSVERNQPAVLLNSCAQLVLWPCLRNWVQITSWCTAIDSQLRQNFFSNRVVKLWTPAEGSGDGTNSELFQRTFWQTVPTTDTVWNGNTDQLKMPNETTIQTLLLLDNTIWTSVNRRSAYTGPKDDDDDDDVTSTMFWPLFVCCLLTG